MKESKRFKALVEKVDQEKEYSLQEAIAWLK
jgi:ribosomal protein L1